MGIRALARHLLATSYIIDNRARALNFISVYLVWVWVCIDRIESSCITVRVFVWNNSNIQAQNCNLVINH